MTHLSSQQQAARYFMNRAHVDVPQQPLHVRAAWRGDEIRAQGEFRYELNAAQIDDIESALAAIATKVPTLSLTSADLPLPHLAAMLKEWRDELAAGRGFVVISGLPVQRWPEATCERFFWMFGQHLGTPGLQNPQGDLLGHVTDTGDAAVDPLVRLYRTASNINYHCDGSDVVGLLCLKTAPTGGISRIVSSVTVFNELLKRRPDLAARLFAPVRFDRRNEQKAGEPPFSQLQPSCFDGEQLRTFYHSDYFRSVVRHVGTLPADEQDFLDTYEAIAEREDLRLDMQFAPGDIQLLSNHFILHARTAYDDNAAAKRHLLRLWLSL